MNYLDLPIKEIHASLLRKEVTPLELVREAVDRAKSNQDHCFECILEEEAIAFASSLGEPEEDNLLWGVPYVLKDNFSTKGLATTGSSNILKDYRPLFDATVVRLLKQRKAILIGKTALDELGMGGTGTTGHLGTTYNPWDPKHERMIGGSSSGSAAAVGAGIVPFAIGSDTGDSARKPAAYAGIIGVKPTWGRISRYGLFPFAPSMDAVGYFTRHVEDAAIVLEALAGRDDKDATSSFENVENYALKASLPLCFPRIVVLDEIVEATEDEAIRKTFFEAIEKLQKQGADVRHVHFGKELLEAIAVTYAILSSAEATSNNANLDGVKFGLQEQGDSYQEIMKKTRTEGFSAPIKTRFIVGAVSLMKENREQLFVRAKKCRAKIVERVNEILQDADFILTPTAPSIPPKFEDIGKDVPLSDRYLPLANFAGLPAVSMPLGYKDGMPFGAHIMTRPFEEGNLLSLCYSIEKTSGIYGDYAGKEGK